MPDEFTHQGESPRKLEVKGLKNNLTPGGSLHIVICIVGQQYMAKIYCVNIICMFACQGKKQGVY